MKRQQTAQHSSQVVIDKRNKISININVYPSVAAKFDSTEKQPRSDKATPDTDPKLTKFVKNKKVSLAQLTQAVKRGNVAPKREQISSGGDSLEALEKTNSSNLLPPTPELTYLEEVQSLQSIEKLDAENKKASNGGTNRKCSINTRNKTDQTSKILTRRMINSKLEKLAFSTFNRSNMRSRSS